MNINLNVFAIEDGTAHVALRTYCGGGYDARCGEKARGLHVLVWHKGGIRAALLELGPTEHATLCPGCFAKESA